MHYFSLLQRMSRLEMLGQSKVWTAPQVVQKVDVRIAVGWRACCQAPLRWRCPAFFALTAMPGEVWKASLQLQPCCSKFLGGADSGLMDLQLRQNSA